jgi:hypothetical protein
MQQVPTSPDELGAAILRTFFREDKPVITKPIDISPEYIWNTVAIRKAFLEALIDCPIEYWSDATLRVNSTYMGSPYMRHLVEKIKFIANSLGISCIYDELNGQVVFFKKILKFDVSSLDLHGNYYGFELDGNHRYLDGNCIVHHNSNSKSKLVELYEKAFGEYCCKFPITLLTMKRAASNAATSELARAKGKRFASLQEPSEGEQINCGFMKELSGGDKIMARSLFKEPIEFVPQFKMALLCTSGSIRRWWYMAANPRR